MIGDSMKYDVIAPKELGWKAMQIDRKSVNGKLDNGLVTISSLSELI